MMAVSVFVLLLSAPAPLHAQEAAARIDLTQHPVGYLALLIFFVAYGFVAVEEVIQLRKSKPVMLAAASSGRFSASSTPRMDRVPRSKPPPSM